MTTELKTGMEFIFVPTGGKLRLKTVTDKKVIWFVGFTYKGGTGKNTLKTAGISRKQFEDAIKRGIYVIL